VAYFNWRRVSDHELMSWYTEGAGRPYHEALAARNALPAEEKGVFNAERARRHSLTLMSNEARDGQSDRYRAAQAAVDRARAEVMQTPGPHLKLEKPEAGKVRALSAAFGMTFPDLPPAPWPRTEDYGLTEDFYKAGYGRDRGAQRPVPERSPEELRRLAEFGAARMKAASSHQKSDVPGIPEHKLVIDAAMEANHEGWIILDVECGAAVGTWQKLVRENGQVPLLRDVAAAGLDPGIWTGWLAYLNKAASREGCYHLSTLGSLRGYRILEVATTIRD
jgi:hypothetical protein